MGAPESFTATTEVGHHIGGLEFQGFYQQVGTFFFLPVFPLQPGGPLIAHHMGNFAAHIKLASAIPAGFPELIVLIFLLGWPFEWPAIILVFLPIFYPVMKGLEPALSVSLGIQPDMLMVWFGTVVAVTMQTAYLSPPVAMSAYYLRQVVKDWSLATIYKGMFEFMMLQVIAITLIVMFPAIATWFPEVLQAEARAVKTEQVDDSMNRLEEDPLQGMETTPSLEEEEQPGAEEEAEAEAGGEEEADSLEKDDLGKSK